MAVTAKMVKELREMTGAGMMDCKKALVETDGNIEAAVDLLKEKGLAKAAKKAGRVAAMGLVRTAIAADGKSAAIVEVNSETDFVAKNEKFQNFVAAVAEQAVNSDNTELEAFLDEAWHEEPSKTVKEVLVEQIAVIGENLKIRRFQKVTAPLVVSYTHGGGRIGVLVVAETAVEVVSVPDSVEPPELEQPEATIKIAANAAATPITPFFIFISISPLSSYLLPKHDKFHTFQIQAMLLKQCSLDFPQFEYLRILEWLPQLMYLFLHMPFLLFHLRSQYFSYLKLNLVI